MRETQEEMNLVTIRTSYEVRAGESGNLTAPRLPFPEAYGALPGPSTAGRRIKQPGGRQRRDREVSRDEAGWKQDLWPRLSGRIWSGAELGIPSRARGTLAAKTGTNTCDVVLCRGFSAIASNVVD